MVSPPLCLQLSEGEGECELLIVGVAGAGAMFLRAAYPAATPAGNVANAGTAVVSALLDAFHPVSSGLATAQPPQQLTRLLSAATSTEEGEHHGAD